MCVHTRRGLSINELLNRIWDNVPAGSARRGMASALEGAASIDAALVDTLAVGAVTADHRDTAPTAAAAGVVVNGRTVYLGGAADDRAMCAAVDDAAATTVFATASISKTFTAALALQCAEREELNLDADINLALARGGKTTPGRVGNPHFPAETQVTARQLLTHTSGLIDDESNLEHGSPYRWPAGVSTTVNLAQYVQRELARDAAPAAAMWSSKAPPGSAPYHYSNAGFALLGLVIERAAGISLPELARERLFQPLGMESTAYFLSELEDEREEGLHFAAPQGQPEPKGHYEVAEYPAAQVRSTAADLCRWLSFLTRQELEPESEFTTEVEPVLSAESIHAMLPSAGTGALAWWGMDAQYSEKRQGQFEHGGFMQGIRSHIYLWPQVHRSGVTCACGCVVLLNGEASYETVVSAIKQLLGVSKL